MGKQATQGLKDLHYADATVEEDGEVRYGTPVKVSDIQKATITINASSDDNYMDDTVGDSIESFEGGTCNIDLYGILNSVLARWSGHTVDDNGVTVKKSTDEAPYIALGFKVRKRNQKYKYVWLLLCKKQTQDENYETKGAKIKPITNTIPFKIFEREDNKWQYVVDEDDEGVDTDLDSKWFKQVYDGTFS